MQRYFLYRVNKITNEVNYEASIGYNEFKHFTYDQIKRMVNKELFIITATDSHHSGGVPIFIIDLDMFMYQRNKYYLNEQNLLINKNNSNKRIFKKYIDVYAYPNVSAENGIRYAFKIKNLKRQDTHKHVFLELIK